jgi:hypothetical protein
LAEQDTFSVDIPNLRRVQNGPDRFQYDSGTTRIYIDLDRNEEGQIAQVSISVRTPNFTLRRDFGDFAEGEEEIEMH